MQVPGSKRTTPPKVFENKRATILSDFQIQTNKVVVAANHLDIGVVHKQDKKAIVENFTVLSGSNIRKKE